MSITKNEIYLILENIRSLFNIGSIFRSADAFGATKIYLGGYSGFPPQKQMAKIAKTALGAEKTIAWEHIPQTTEIVEKLKQQKVSIVALELTKTAKPLAAFKPKFPLALIVGNEVTGISKEVLELADHIVYIPMQGHKESLNVAIAASLALYDFTIIKNKKKPSSKGLIWSG